MGRVNGGGMPSLYIYLTPLDNVWYFFTETLDPERFSDVELASVTAVVSAAICITRMC